MKCIVPLYLVYYVNYSENHTKRASTYTLGGEKLRTGRTSQMLMYVISINGEHINGVYDGGIGIHDKSIAVFMHCLKWGRPRIIGSVRCIVHKVSAGNYCE